MSNEADLLRRYAEENSETAFNEFVRHTIDFVYAAALRRLDGNTHAASDVAQQVFISAARHARALSHHPRVTSWLHAATRNAALDLMRDEILRRQREHAAGTESDGPAGTLAPAEWDRLRPVLDAAIDELNERDREAVLLRFFQSRTFGEIGTRLQLSENGARMRVERALDKLHALLVKRGIRSTTAALGFALANEVTLAAPHGLAASVAGVALADTAMTGSSAWAVTLGFMTTTKSLVTLGVLLALAGTVAFYQHALSIHRRAALEEARTSVAASEVKLSELTAEAEAARRRRAGLEHELRQRQTSAASARQASQASREAERAATEKATAEKYAFNAAALPILRFDPQLQELRRAKHRWEVNQDYRPLFKEFHFTPEQTERFVRLFADWTESRPDRGEPFLLVPYVNQFTKPDELIAQIRREFGSEVATRFLELDATRGPRKTVSTISYRLYHLDDPFTAQQAESLAQVCADAGVGRRGLGESFVSDTPVNWTEVLAKSERLLSAKQMDGLRAVASQARVNELVKSAGGK